MQWASEADGLWNVQRGLGRAVSLDLGYEFGMMSSTLWTFRKP